METKKLQEHKTLTNLELHRLITAMYDNSENIEHYRDDIGLDVKLIFNNTGGNTDKDYLWITRDTGTHIYNLDNWDFEDIMELMKNNYSEFRRYIIHYNSDSNLYDLHRLSDYNINNK